MDYSMNGGEEYLNIGESKNNREDILKDGCFFLNHKKICSCSHDEGFSVSDKTYGNKIKWT